MLDDATREAAVHEARRAQRLGPAGGAMAAVLALAGCPVADLTWTGPGDFGPVRSSEWIRYTVRSDITFTPEFTLNYLVLSTVGDLCAAYQDAVAASYDAHREYTAARQPFEEADDLRSPELCALTQEYYRALAEATADVAKRGTAYVSTSFGYAGTGLVLEEGIPQEGTFSLTNDPMAEDGDFFRTFVRFYDGNPYVAALEALDCGDPAWGDATALPGYTQFRGEPNPEGEPGQLRSEYLADDLVHVAHEAVLAVNAERTKAGILDTNADYLLCELTTDRFFLRVFER